MNTRTLCTPIDHRLSRRHFLAGLGAAGIAAVSGGPELSSSIADEARKRGKQVLFVWLDGGLSQLESWDPKPDTTFGGPFRSIATAAPDIRIGELLPNTAKWMNHLSLVRSLETQDNAHSSGVDRIQRGDPKNRGVAYPFFGSAVAHFLGSGTSGLPPYISIKPMSGGFFYKDGGFLGAKYGALALGDGKPPENLLRPTAIGEPDDIIRNDIRRQLDSEYARAHRKTFSEANSHVYEMAAQLQKQSHLFDASTFTARDVERYGTHDLGRHLLIARRMLEAGVTFVKVTSFGWDSHGDCFNGQGNLIPKFDRPFAAIVEDLHQRGMLDNVLVIAISEFGRTPRINGHTGRDHWPEAWSAIMGGCGIKKGVVVGKTNPLGTWVTDKPMDIGALFHTWFAALGIDSVTKGYHNNDQPLPIANEKWKPVRELLL